jgi:hypothetical protein
MAFRASAEALPKDFEKDIQIQKRFGLEYRNYYLVLLNTAPRDSCPTIPDGVKHRTSLNEW